MSLKGKLKKAVKSVGQKLEDVAETVAPVAPGLSLMVAPHSKDVLKAVADSPVTKAAGIAGAGLVAGAAGAAAGTAVGGVAGAGIGTAVGGAVTGAIEDAGKAEALSEINRLTTRAPESIPVPMGAPTLSYQEGVSEVAPAPASPDRNGLFVWGAGALAVTAVIVVAVAIKKGKAA